MSLDARLDFRLSSQLKELIVEAAFISGQSVSDFAISTLGESARRIVQQNSMTTLSNRDRDIFLAMLDAGSEPNDALKRAAERFKQRQAENAK